MPHAAPPDVVTLGEALVLWAAEQTGPLAAVQSFSQHTAGAETNVAVGLARLGLRVGWVSRLGDDANGVYLRQAFEREGVDCSHVATVPGGFTASMRKGRVDDGSDPPIAYQRANSAASQLGPEHLDLPWLASARHLHVTGIFPALSASTMAATQAAMRHMRAHHKTISFDPNLRPALWPDRAVMRDSLNALAAQADWVLPGLDEGRQLTGCDTPQNIARFYREAGATQVVVKLGAQGAYVDGPAGCAFVPAFPVAQVVDTVGAGDAFAVGVISALLEGASLEKAARRGAWLGARAVQVRGDCEGLPTRAELNAAGV
ncbi:2-dehydro-3-deoxygluconokinase [Limnohabitans sp. TS-CS-82]|uniref:sugar kinase n=1 Tax=Limnohabitans sp. TS-CS-82 TaxID=2094193 RepID=UPI000CF28C1E|nr:sugar kinase [Limnohabitans sp. TS-CS-82]PQA83613.1 2-dehydro-3-deoxygluconokinase [Limnohabitans sp. TS-CS-82]